MFPDMTDSAQHLRSAVKAFIERRKLKSLQRGTRALRQPLLRPRPARRTLATLDTADRLLDFIGLEPIGPRFRREVDAYLAVTRPRPRR